MRLSNGNPELSREQSPCPGRDSSSSAAAETARLLRPNLPHPFRLCPGERIVTSGFECRLTFELAEIGESTSIQEARFYRGKYGASRLLLMTAIIEPAPASEIRYVGERGRDTPVVSSK